MTTHTHYGSRRGSRAAGRAAQPHSQPHSSPPTEPEVTSGAGGQGGTPEDVLWLEKPVRNIVVRLALALLQVERLLPETDLEDWGDNVKPAIDLLFRFGGSRK